jgi:signal transduction histidine kinase
MLSSDIRGLLFQAARELFVNIAKHAKAQHVRVCTKSDDRFFTLNVEDDGIGFNPNKHVDTEKENCFGLFSISERITYIGGQIDILSEPGCGTKIRLCVPINMDDLKNGENS